MISILRLFIFYTSNCYVILSCLCIPYTSWKYVGMDVKHRGVMSFEISEKCRKRPLSKNENTKAVRHFEENNYQPDDLHLNRYKIDK